VHCADDGLEERTRLQSDNLRESDCRGVGGDSEWCVVVVVVVVVVVLAMSGE
jgi:hypothetical protein